MQLYESYTKGKLLVFGILPEINIQWPFCENWKLSKYRFGPNSKRNASQMSKQIVYYPKGTIYCISYTQTY